VVPQDNRHYLAAPSPGVLGVIEGHWTSPNFVEEEKYMDQLANLLISGSPSVLALYAMNNV
jgi:hypothetical protein